MGWTLILKSLLVRHRILPILWNPKCCDMGWPPICEIFIGETWDSSPFCEIFIGKTWDRPPFCEILNGETWDGPLLGNPKYTTGSLCSIMVFTVHAWKWWKNEKTQPLLKCFYGRRFSTWLFCSNKINYAGQNRTTRLWFYYSYSWITERWTNTCD